MKPLYTLLIGAIVGFLCAFLIFWNSSSEQKGRFVEIKGNKQFVTKSNKPFYQPQKLPERTSTQGGTLFSNRLQRDTPLVKKDIKGPVQGKVTIIDWCSRLVFIDDVPFDMGSLDLVGIIEMGDRVEVTYTDTNQGKVIESIYVLR
jgi:hypothetical protein